MLGNIEIEKSDILTSCESLGNEFQSLEVNFMDLINVILKDNQVNIKGMGGNKEYLKENLSTN